MKKRGAIYSVVALMLCLAVYLNWYYTKTDGDYGNATDYQADGKVLGESILVNGAEERGADTLAAQTENEYFSQARLSRQQARDEAVTILTRTAESAASTEEARTAASTGIQVMADNAVVESRIENLVIAKGYEDCVTFVNDNGVNVIVAKTENGLTDTDVAKIRDIVISEASVTADAIKIMENEAD
ncbi:MAG: SpoIIIAH-like family protein [Clostridia bacterium]|nr:SpoIIIAH-like family protein [Clostridia bacterium]